MARTVAVAALFVTSLVLGVAGSATPAAAADGMALLCNRADYGCVDHTGYRGQSYWGANFNRVGHNCTSYVSYRLAMAGAAQPWFTMGNANQWDEKGRGKVPIDDIPAVGSVAQWEGGTRLAPGARGHVGYVEAVNATSIEITDDSSSGGTRRYTITRGSPYWPDNFIHILDTPTAPTLSSASFNLASKPAVKGLKPIDTGSTFQFGAAGELPVAGNWDGKRGDSVGTFRDGGWMLTNSNRTSPAKRIRLDFGGPGDLPIVGDWDGDGRDSVGVFRDGTFLLTDDLLRPEIHQQFAFGEPGDVPVAGDWDGDGVDTVGVYRDGVWVLSNGHQANALRTMQLSFGHEGYLPVVGNWDGKRGDSIGVFRDGVWVLRNRNASGPEKLLTLRLGAEGDIPLPGAWTAGSTLPGIAR
ncbi:MAG: CHAP domain-containing protein [Actinomycetota bacterium]|nr:CHAP domain-containing protein [Actinomycetota bacterium]